MSDEKEEIIAFICEGEVTEPRIIENLKRAYFENTKKIIKILSFQTDIYQLWEKIKEDENLDAIEIIRERNEDSKEKLKPYQRTDIPQVYLFFDYDGHATKASDEKIAEMLEYFDNETENGKIYISYPMVEAVRHIQKNVSFELAVVDSKIKGKEYKALSSQICYFNNISKLNRNDWSFIFGENIKKGNLIVNAQYSFPDTYAEFRINLIQKNLFQNQLQKYIQPRSEVAVLSGFPFFIVDYFGETLFNGIKNCSESVH
ncbi:MAG: hypothetical protein RLZZ612_109 [Pseudomonadota bacterium]|jgi:hypothetical protein